MLPSTCSSTTSATTVSTGCLVAVAALLRAANDKCLMTGQFSTLLQQGVQSAALLGLSFMMLLLQTELDSANVTWEYFDYGETVHAFTEPDLVNTGSVSQPSPSTEQGHGSAVLTDPACGRWPFLSWPAGLLPAGSSFQTHVCLPGCWRQFYG